jgi:amino acid transporter
MNKTQKGALVNLAIMPLSIAAMMYPLVEVFVFKRMPERFGLYWVVIVFCVVMVASIILLRRKQSANEVESDERDVLIKKRAVIASFVSVWILLYASIVIPWFVVGLGGSIPVFLLPFINVGIFLVVMLVYSVAVLIQYGWGGKRGEK